MNKRNAIGIILLIFAVSVALILQGMDRMPKKEQTTKEDQLSEILAAQKRMEQKLNKIEAVQEVIVKSLEAMPKQPTRAARPTPPPMPSPDKEYDIPVAHTPINGPKDAKVTIVEVSEVQCPFSKRFHPIINQVMEAYPEKVNHLFKHFPLGFHPQAEPGAKAVLAAGEQGKYYEMLDLLFQKGPLPRVQGESQEDLLKRLEEFYESLAKELNMDVKKFMKDYKERDAQWEKIIAEDMALARKINVRGTPTFFINGKNTRARDLNSFKREIDQILEEQESKK